MKAEGIEMLKKRKRSIAWRLVFIVPLIIVIVVVQMIRGESRFTEIEGKIVRSYVYKTANSNDYMIILDSDDQTYIAPYSVDFTILSEKATIGKNATILYKFHTPRGRFSSGQLKGRYIKKLSIDGEVILPYRKNTVVNMFIIAILIGLLSTNLFILINKDA